jgi:hypothetical protein
MHYDEDSEKKYPARQLVHIEVLAALHVAHGILQFREQV